MERTNAAHQFYFFQHHLHKFLLGWLEAKQMIYLIHERQKPLGKNKRQVAILGNCKRFDVYVALAHPVEKQQVKWHISQVALVQRTGHFQKTPVGLGEIDGEIDGDGGYFGNWRKVVIL